MSTLSGTQNVREGAPAELMQELKSMIAMNNSLRAYLEHLRSFKSNLIAMNKNYQQLSSVNSEWIDLISKK